MYFTQQVNPASEVSSGVILIDNFHPKWKEGGSFLANNDMFQKRFEEYVRRIKTWTRVPLDYEFDKDVGLTHLRTESRDSLDLDARGERYVSHNINGVVPCCAVLSVMNFYINNLSFKLRDIVQR